MKDDDLLQTIARAAKQERADAHDHFWEAMIEGPGEAPPPIDDEALRAAMELDLLRPIDTDRLNAMAEGLGVSLGDAPASGVPSAERLAPVIPLRRRWLPGLSVACAGLAAAAGIALWLGTSPADSLPGYQIASVSGDVAMRGEHAEAAPAELRLSKGGRFELVIRPDAGVEGPIGAITFVLRGSEATELPIPAEISPQGAVRVQGLVDDTLPLGHFSFAIVVGRPEAVANVVWPVSPSERDLQVLRVPANRVE